MSTERQGGETAIEGRARIEMLKTRVVKTAETGEPAQPAHRNTEPEKVNETKWRVDWDAVGKTEAWLKKEWSAGRRGWAGPPGAYDILPSAVPKEVVQIGGVLLSRCAGYAVVPKPREVAAAVKADTPTEQEWYALKTYLLEATGVEIRTACQAGEIDVRKLMQRVEEIIESDGLYGLRGVKQWLTQ